MFMKPSIPKGTRDFGQEEMAARNYIFDTIRSVYRTYGYVQIETPAMENLSTLLGKYGDEGDKLLFRILNSGDAFSGVDFEECRNEDGSLNSNKVSMKVCEKGLRYDLTVPFARYVVQHQNEIAFPFRRFQIQPVWRADRPQKGRYREFYQCDADVIGSKSQLNELELVQIVDRVFTKFGINVAIKINNRKVLTGLAEIAGFPDKVTDITVAIDKLDKIGLEAVEAEMKERGLTDQAVAVIEPVLLLEGTTAEKIETMRGLMQGKSASGIVSETGLLGLDELAELFGFIEAAGVGQKVEMDLSLARGLNYYTGAIFEVKALDYAIGSICGGGRYDNLTGIFGLPGMSGVGISFGADRIYDVLKGLDKFPKDIAGSATVLFANMDAEALSYIIPVVKSLREAGVACEIYPDKSKLKKQFDYADRKGIPFVSINGGDEAASGIVNLKNLSSGEQKTFAKDDVEGMKAFFAAR
ncbi:MAG: histidine--tRNA ligase [Candidatus Cryptobacteroides sp.]|nr:histidine--tRNA ligase [Bacteroidales bacterium]MDD7154673.1 histidine--tRNA ligase [Bacteroidales bacterium]MDY5262321.1 histidine--tRNA ligase [Candidatus Cryptobacteroides sp.]MDY5494447.1 histidine--tRNA ligase [Candidatus Cryptobacteroides sp.]